MKLHVFAVICSVCLFCSSSYPSSSSSSSSSTPDVLRARYSGTNPGFDVMPANVMRPACCGLFTVFDETLFVDELERLGKLGCKEAVDVLYEASCSCQSALSVNVCDKRRTLDVGKFLFGKNPLPDYARNALIRVAEDGNAHAMKNMYKQGSVYIKYVFPLLEERFLTPYSLFEMFEVNEVVLAVEPELMVRYPNAKAILKAKLNKEIEIMEEKLVPYMNSKIVGSAEYNELEAYRKASAEYGEVYSAARTKWEELHTTKETEWVDGDEYYDVDYRSGAPIYQKVLRETGNIIVDWDGFVSPQLPKEPAWFCHGRIVTRLSSFREALIKLGATD